jgi:hypothetical protein
MIGHFKVWLIKPVVDFAKDVRLKGQFDARDKEVAPDRIEWLMGLGNPVSKNKEPIVNPNAHLTVYRLSGPTQPRRLVTFSNQLTEGKDIDWEVQEPVVLLVPAEKVEKDSRPPRDLEHFKCYNVTHRRDIERHITLKDQFDREKEEEIKVLTPFLFAVPVQKNGEPFKNRDDHLAIYEIHPQQGLEKKVTITDQYFPDGKQITVSHSAWLCVPSIKKGFKTEHR